MHRASALGCAFLFCLSTLPAGAEIGTLDNVPAATLLLPYFEVDLGGTSGPTTLFAGKGASSSLTTLTTLLSVNNAFAGPVIAHVTFWTDLSVPTLDFNLYLTGYEDPTINLRDTFVSRRPPRSRHELGTKGLGGERVGIFSLATNPVTGVDRYSAGCAEQLPLPDLPPILLDHIRNAHTGKPSAVFGGLCSGVDHGDSVARGYITIDNVNSCTLDFPGDTGYFSADGNGAANNQNVLWGDYFYVNATENFAQGETLVHLEASPEVGGTGPALGAANYTFYRRYSGGADQREGLGSSFAVRYATGGPFDGGTDLVVWRDAKRAVSPFNCALGPPQPFPLSQNQVVIFDEDENPDVPDSSPFSPAIPGASLIPFPWEAQSTEINGPSFPVPFSFGWLYLNLNSAVAGSQVPFEPLMGNFVTAAISASGRFSLGYDAIQLDNLTRPEEASDVILPVGCEDQPQPCP